MTGLEDLSALLRAARSNATGAQAEEIQPGVMLAEAQAAAFHATVVQGGYSTPEIEAKRLSNDRSVIAGREGPMSSTDLVGPVGVVHFGPFGRAGSVVYTPPGNTCDPRYDACTSHHVACDCREAEMAEQRAEWADEHRGVQEAFDQILAGHSTGIMGAPNPYTGESDNPCACTGCQIARATFHYPRRAS